jgi:hypothetical protein
MKAMTARHAAATMTTMVDAVTRRHSIHQGERNMRRVLIVLAMALGLVA